MTPLAQTIAARPPRQRFDGDRTPGTGGRNPGSARLDIAAGDGGIEDLAAALLRIDGQVAALVAAIADGSLVPGSGEAGLFGVGAVQVEAEEPAYPVDDRIPEFGAPIPVDWSPDDPTGGGAWALSNPTYLISPGGQCGPGTEPDIVAGGFVTASERAAIGVCHDDAGLEIIGDLISVTLTVYAPV